jgi:mannose-6-phosphate isomerase-like protein (cupin superfamily)
MIWIYLFLILIAVVVVALIARKFLKHTYYNVWVGDIEKITIENEDWRHVLHTADNLQVVAMSVPVGQELGMETHQHNDQFFRVESGVGRLETVGVGGNRGRYELKDGFSAVVPHGTQHNLINIGDKPLKLYTIYGPPHHPPGTIHRTHADEPRN